jgi:hypothetical protein
MLIITGSNTANSIRGLSGSRRRLLKASIVGGLGEVDGSHLALHTITHLEDLATGSDGLKVGRRRVPITIIDHDEGPHHPSSRAF